ncbi:MAG: hypothetical protein LBL93_02255 [Ruminococcus sp.]|jgi:hypothetical protein|nr:hypothetical protein [Ruminococcus sp.]
MTDREVVNETIKYAKKYHNNLEYKNLMFIYKDYSDKFSYFEVAFLPKNFLHLTGLTLNNRTVRGAEDFYRLALNGRLNTSHFTQNKNGQNTTRRNARNIERKFLALSYNMEIHINAREFGDYIHMGGNLNTEKLCGNSNACLGFILSGGEYLPNTNLKIDVRDYTEKPYTVLFVLRKDRRDTHYNEITYANSNFNFQTLHLTEILSDKLTDAAIQSI